jgi:CHAD domain-containing protein
MAYRLDLSDDVPASIRRCASEQLADAARLLRDEAAEDPVESVHGARKDLKKTRSLLRLARPGMRSRDYRRETAALRSIARSLSATRDADVMVQTVDALAERFAGRLPKKAFREVRTRFVREARASRAAIGTATSPQIIDELDAASAGAESWNVDACDLATLRAGAVRAYDRGRRAMRKVEADPSVEHLHEWRKRVKDLWYHARLLQDAWPGLFEAQANEAHALSDLLGDDHDLAVLAERLTASGDAVSAAPVDHDAMLELVAERRAGLHADALRLGRRLYAERAKAFGRRLARYLDGLDAPEPVAQPA